ncbi:uncharacterized protein Z518_05894 [Rhinocladiella mackenziei CBS 650.93]|uniref:AB hydrolase-1 domain-containing protein n=1 Tax=Rhinocladiella mackenziei CBS 650.93 TaxID=1442369 RepID=A0A0D2FSE3_9EURO|nr:uncharacterized protein Z518_05894 [Rhinocladiella mackenziei CBS 650.93]KIX05022.1 hypothetical protein Z518_05894 [Rhinocladiella mackenziei CBS 650.93]
MPYFEVEGASLYYETVGSGPLLFCIHGGNGSGDIWKLLAESLKDQYTVAFYDRRGFSRSYLAGSQDYEHRLERDADDARELIEHLSKDPATVIGNSSGAIVSLALLSRHPDVIRALIPHEPPAIMLLPDKDKLSARQRDVYDTYRKRGVSPALKKFVELNQAGPEGQIMVATFDPRSGPFVSQNMMYWFEREFLDYPLHEIDLAALEKNKHRLLPANGQMTNPEALQYRANVVLCKKFGRKLMLLPGGHVGFTSHFEAFAKQLLEALKEFEKTPGKL